MKQSAAKTLGVAALGAAFAATAAGSASAVGVVPTGAVVEAVAKSALPVAQSALTQAPGGASEALGTGQGLVGAVTQGASLPGVPVDPSMLGGLLGGLPVGGQLGQVGAGA
ncbi:ATP-binding protein [Streptomyces sp. NPDC050856]|uniref:ATP-binding protein n=1 Tax=Streptomyces sp. NPDC050856 TaxID=3154939 RepID=UPI0034029145